MISVTERAISEVQRIVKEQNGAYTVTIQEASGGITVIAIEDLA